MKSSLKSVLLTTVLLIVLLVIIYIEIAIYISGPARAYEKKIVAQQEVIQEQYPNIKNIQRHAFQYIVYSGEDTDAYLWLNENGELVTSREKSTLQMEEVVSTLETTYGITDATIILGYGYDNPVYVAKIDNREILLDYDTLELVYDLREGESR